MSHWTRICAVKETRFTCPYCGAGCGVAIESQGAQITGVRAKPPARAEACRGADRALQAVLLAGGTAPPGAVAVRSRQVKLGGSP